MMVKYNLSPRQKQLHNTANVTLGSVLCVSVPSVQIFAKSQSGVKAECMPTPAQTLNFNI